MRETERKKREIKRGNKKGDLHEWEEDLSRTVPYFRPTLLLFFQPKQTTRLHAPRIQRKDTIVLMGFATKPSDTKVTLRDHSFSSVGTWQAKSLFPIRLVYHLLEHQIVTRDV